MSVVVAALVLLAAPTVAAPKSADAPTVVAGGINPENEKTDWFRLQVGLDVGLPDGVALGLSLAPLPHVRLSVAALTNVIGFGIRGGLALVPFASWTIHPILSLELGHYFTGNAQQFIATAPKNLRYDFVDATAGVELSLTRVVIRLVGGAAHISGSDYGSNVDGYPLSGNAPCVKLSVGMKIN